MPPMMMTGVSSAKKEFLNDLTTLRAENFPSAGMPLFLARYQLTSIMDIPIMMPGMKPPTNRSPMEVSAMAPYTTMVMEGGMTMPVTPLAATIPVAQPRS